MGHSIFDEKLEEMLDSLTLKISRGWQNSGYIEPAEEGSIEYYLEARTISPHTRGQILMVVVAKTPVDAIRKWNESFLFPNPVYEVRAYASLQQYKNREKPLAIVRGNSQ